MRGHRSARRFKLLSGRPLTSAVNVLREGHILHGADPAHRALECETFGDGEVFFEVPRFEYRLNHAHDAGYKTFQQEA